MSNIYQVPAGHTIAITPTAGVPVHARRLDDATIGAVVRVSQTFGPYLSDCEFVVGAPATVTVAIAAASDSIAGMLMFGDAAPVSAVRAAIEINPNGNENGLTFTAVAYGTDGNLITVQYDDPGANDATLAVRVSGNTIVVSLATDGSGTITSTAAEVLAAINAEAKAAELVTPTIYAADGGGVDDGSGVVTAMARTALEGGAGTGIGSALPGALYLRTGTGVVYRNSGTTAAPTWTTEVQSGYATSSSTVNTLAALHLYGAGVPVDYTDGSPPATGEGTSPKGAIYSDTTNGFVYRNSGTQAQPLWTKLGDAA